jgi:hypothetical protein
MVTALQIIKQNKVNSLVNVGVGMVGEDMVLSSKNLHSLL